MSRGFEKNQAVKVDWGGGGGGGGKEGGADAVWTSSQLKG